MIIYKCENILNKNCYIGKSVNDLNTRMTQHFSDARTRKNNNRFLNALKKYGKEGFKWSVLWKGKCSKEWIDDLERYYIYFYNTCYMKGGHGYNGTFGGEGISSETAVRINKLRDYSWLSERNRKCVGPKNPNYGKKKPKLLKMNLENNPMKNPEIVKKSVAKRKKCVLIVNLKSGEEFISHGYLNWCKENNISNGNFCGVLKGKLKQTKGFWGTYIE